MSLPEITPQRVEWMVVTLAKAGRGYGPIYSIDIAQRHRELMTEAGRMLNYQSIELVEVTAEEVRLRGLLQEQDQKIKLLEERCASAQAELEKGRGTAYGIRRKLAAGGS